MLPGTITPLSPGDLETHIDVLHLRNIHAFLQSGCSEHLRLHLRILRAFVWLLDLFLLHHWDFYFSFSELPQFPVPLVSLRYENWGENLHINDNSSFCFSCAPSTVFCIVRTDLSTSTEMSTTLSVNCSLITLHGFFLDGLDFWNLPV